MELEQRASIEWSGGRVPRLHCAGTADPTAIAASWACDSGEVPVCISVEGVKGEAGGWFSPPGSGACFSLLLPDLPEFAHAWLRLVGLLGVAQAVESVAGSGAERFASSLSFHWPDGLYWKGRRFGRVSASVAGDGTACITVCVNLLEHDNYPAWIDTSGIAALEAVLWKQVDASSLIGRVVAALMERQSRLSRGDLSPLLEEAALRAITGIPAPGARLFLTLGCPAGVGPEVAAKALAKHPEWLLTDGIRLVGDPNVFKRACRIIGAEIPFHKVLPDGTVIETRDGVSVPLWAVTSLDLERVRFGRPSETTGRASYLYLKRAIELCLRGEGDGIVTSPISKAGLRMAGISHPGHTEILAEMSGAGRVAMMLAGPRLKVILVTIHEPLAAVPGLLTEERVFETIEICRRALLHDFGISSPRIAVAALNPHAGEEGLFGDEEVRVIAPAVEMARRKGWSVDGPFPPDTVFYRAARGEFHAVVCQYHDQGLIPFKLLHFEDGVNVTLGLPFVRTSVDHGTAYDIAGTGRADSSSMEAALELGMVLAANRRRLEGRR